MEHIDSLMDRLERVKLYRATEAEPDELSNSLWELGAELSALDEYAVAAKAEELGITSDDVREMARTYMR